MESWGSQNFADCQLGDKRLNQRALLIGKALVVGFGQAFSMIFKDKNLLKRAYEFFANPKAQFNQLTQPHRENTARFAAKKASCASCGRHHLSRVTRISLLKEMVTVQLAMAAMD